MLFRQMTFAAIAALMCLFVANDVMAQRGGFGGRGNSKLEYLGNKKVQDELGILDEQLEDIEALGSEARDVMRNAFSGMREKFQDLSREERDELMTEIRAKIKEDMKAVEEKVDDILVPHQTERLDQLLLQGQMGRNGVPGALEGLREKLGISESEFDELAEKLKEKEKEVKEKLDEDIKKLRAEAQDEVLSVLPADMQAKIKQMIGESFEFQRDRGGRGGGRGDRGGRGGDRGGRGGGRGGRGGDRGGF